MPKILILGDCIATGQNCLLEEIIGTHPLFIENDFQRMDKEREKFVMAWFLKNYFKNKDGVTSLKYQDIFVLAKKKKLEEEKKLAWPNFIKADVTNLSVAGETFEGMQQKLKFYLYDNNFPDLVLLTDFDDTHCCAVVNSQNKKYIVKRPYSLIEEPQSIWPDEVYEKFKKVIKKQANLRNFFLRKNKKSLYQLKKFMKYQNLKFKFVCFQEWFKKIETSYIDCTQFVQTYKIQNITNIGKKKKLQPYIAEYVYKNIINYF